VLDEADITPSPEVLEAFGQAALKVVEPDDAAGGCQATIVGGRDDVEEITAEKAAGAGYEQRGSGKRHQRVAER
jgi:hypothetical protein